MNSTEEIKLFALHISYSTKLLFIHSFFGPDPNRAKTCGSVRIWIRNTDKNFTIDLKEILFDWSTSLTLPETSNIRPGPTTSPSLKYAETHNTLHIQHNKVLKTISFHLHFLKAFFCENVFPFLLSIFLSPGRKPHLLTN